MQSPCDLFSGSGKFRHDSCFCTHQPQGGVGKSTSATTLALGLSAILRCAGTSNSRVLLIDTDSQGHATLITTGQKDYGVDNSLYTVLAADRQVAAQTWASCIVPSTWDPDLHVLPASPLPECAERELMQVAGAPYRLADPLYLDPMRRTNKTMPSFPADFDGAALRH